MFKINEQNAPDTHGTEIMIAKIKEANISFFAHLADNAQKWLDDEYGRGNAKGYVKNASDGCYELFAIIKEEKLM